MPQATYKLTSPKFTGSVKLVYKDGVLSSIVQTLKSKSTKRTLAPDSVRMLLDLLPTAETEVYGLEKYYKVECLSGLQQSISAAKVKLGIFKKEYKKWFGEKFGSFDQYIEPCYTAKDEKVIEPLDVNEELVHFYLRMRAYYAQEQSLKSFCNFYNEIVLEYQKHQAGMHLKPSSNKLPYPDYWSLDAERKLDPKHYPAWWKHLRGLGWTPNKGGQERFLPPKKTKSIDSVAMSLGNKFKVR